MSAVAKDNFHKKGPVGCLLIHGFTGSPNELLELGEFLTGHDITVSIPVLPGHATHSADMFNYTWRDWYGCVTTAFGEICGCCEEVFVCGLSMGGTLALHLAAHQRMNGVIALSAPVHFPKWKKIAVRTLRNVIKYQYKRTGEDIHDVSAKAKLGSYRRYPVYAVDQLFRLVDHVYEDLPEITQPILIMHSKQDHTIDFSNAVTVFASVSSEDKRKVDLQQSYHVITADVEKERVQKEVLAFIASHSKALKSVKPKTQKEKK